MDGRTFRFLGRRFVIQSDSPAVLREFARVYERFECGHADPCAPAAGAPRPISVCVVTGTPDRKPVLWAQGKPTVLGDGEEMPARIYFYILNSLIEETGTHFILHGGVVQKNGRGLIIAGPSAAGKTTLTVELARRGYPFLSDELAPIHRGTGLIEPFPRRIGIRAHRGEFKDMLDIGELPGGTLGTACRPGWIFFLTPVPEGGAEAGSRTVEISFGTVGEDLLTALRRMEGVLSVERLAARHYPTLRLRLGPGDFAGRLDRLCLALGVCVTGFHNGGTKAPDFTASPRIEPLSGMPGVMETARHLLNGRPPSRLCGEFGNSQAALLVDLAGALSGLRMYRLTPGRLDALVDRIQETLH